MKKFSFDLTSRWYWRQWKQREREQPKLDQPETSRRRDCDGLIEADFSTHKLCTVTNRFSSFGDRSWLWDDHLCCWCRCIGVRKCCIMCMCTSRICIRISLWNTAFLNECFHTFHCTLLSLVFFIEMYLSKTIADYLGKSTTNSTCPITRTSNSKN